MKKKLALVLSGGGARGALQAGALRALFETGYSPQIITGTSIGACNAAFIALNGFNTSSLDKLYTVWEDTEKIDLLPSNYLWLTVRMLFNRNTPKPTNQMVDFLVAHGLKPEICFGDVKDIQLLLTATDLNSYRPVVYGRDAEDSILEAVLASAALPPWVNPIERGQKLLLDGGVVSNLPLQSALDAGASEIIALDLTDPRTIGANSRGFGPFMGKLFLTVQTRQNELERAQAEAKQIPIHTVYLSGKEPYQIWDFTHSKELIEQGYAEMCEAIEVWQSEKRRYGIQKIGNWLQRLTMRNAPKKP
jgi:NTE family protein